VPSVIREVDDREQTLTTAVVIVCKNRQNRWSQTIVSRKQSIYSGGVKR